MVVQQNIPPLLLLTKNALRGRAELLGEVDFFLRCFANKRARSTRCGLFYWLAIFWGRISRLSIFYSISGASMA